MKYLLFIVFSSFVAFANAQDELPAEAFLQLKNIHRIDILVDWSRVRINELSSQEWIEKRQLESPKYNAELELEKILKPQLFSCGIPKANEPLVKYNFKFVRHQDTPILLKMTPLIINNSGKWESEFEFVNTDSNEVLVRFVLEGKKIPAGHNLQRKWESIFQDLGNTLGKFMKKKLKEIYNE